MSPPRVVQFGTFELDLEARELRDKGRRVRLQSQPAQILARLAATPGQLVTREELRRTIWAEDTFVEFDTSLNVAVNKIRLALRDSATSPRFIETVPRQGYRFLADVRPVAATASPASPAAPAPARRNAWRWFAAAVAVSLLFAAAWTTNQPGKAAAPIRSLAVLPFHPLTEETRDEALEVGLAEAIIVRLGQVEQLRLPSIHAVQRYANQPDSRLAGRDLGVEAVLEGSLLRADDRVRISARLIDVATGATRWARQWNLPWTDIFAVQDAMAREVGRELAISLTPADSQSLQAHPTNVAAYDPYLRARYLLLRRSVSDSRRAAELLEEALRLDPTSAEAHASLAFAYVSIPLMNGPVAPFVELSRKAARRALELDPSVAESHAVLARIAIHFDWNPDEAHREIRRALALDPTNAFVLHCVSQMLAEDGRIEEALALADRALALDPASVLANRDRAYILLLARRYDDAVAQSRRALELDPHVPFVHTNLGRALEELGRDEEAVAAYTAPLASSAQQIELAGALRAAAARDGMRGFWTRLLEARLATTDTTPFAVAFTYARLDDHDRALEWLEKAYAARSGHIRALKMNPDWDPLRSDPRFQDLLRRANISPAAIPIASTNTAARVGR